MKETAYAKQKARRNEQRTKVQMIIEAAKRPMTNKEIMENPTMTGMTPHSLNHYLRGVEGIQYENKKWSLNKTNGYARPNGGPTVLFRITRTGSLQLSVNGVCFPVEVEGAIQ